jgi:hypothetical protein
MSTLAAASAPSFAGMGSPVGLLRPGAKLPVAGYIGRKAKAGDPWKSGSSVPNHLHWCVLGWLPQTFRAACPSQHGAGSALPCGVLRKAMYCESSDPVFVHLDGSHLCHENRQGLLSSELWLAAACGTW